MPAETDLISHFPQSALGSSLPTCPSQLALKNDVSTGGSVHLKKERKKSAKGMGEEPWAGGCSVPVQLRPALAALCPVPTPARRPLPVSRPAQGCSCRPLFPLQRGIGPRLASPGASPISQVGVCAPSPPAPRVQVSHLHTPNMQGCIEGLATRKQAEEEARAPSIPHFVTTHLEAAAARAHVDPSDTK